MEIIRPDYPIVAIQQLVRNAVLHRTYEGTNAPVRIQWFSDRIEILSPGGPYGRANRANFGQPGITDYRNPHLAEAMRNLGYVQRCGVGIALARKGTREERESPAGVSGGRCSRTRDAPETFMSVPVIAFFNNRAVLGKWTDHLNCKPKMDIELPAGRMEPLSYIVP